MSEESVVTGETAQRAVPYHCPFCAEEDLRPLESGAVLTSRAQLARGGWHCRSCLRVFSLSFHGLHQVTAVTAHHQAPGSDHR